MASKAKEKKKEKADGKDLTMTFSVNKTPEEVFDAVNNVRGWWSEDIEGRTDKPGGAFKYRYKDMHVSTQKITEFVPGRKVVWHVLDSRINFVKDKDEWTGTDIVFGIARKKGKTELTFTHVGLVPGLECYDACQEGWGFYINESLKRLITAGTGQPDREEKKDKKKAA